MSEDVFHLGVKALLRNAEGKILLLKVDTSKYQSVMSEFWDIPGGRVQRGETIEQTLKREVLEETGINSESLANPIKLDVVLANHRIPNKADGSDFGLLLAIYEIKANSDLNITISSEHNEFRWFSPSEAAELLKIKYPQEFTAKIATL